MNIHQHHKYTDAENAAVGQELHILVVYQDNLVQLIRLDGVSQQEVSQLIHSKERILALKKNAIRIFRNKQVILYPIYLQKWLNSFHGFFSIKCTGCGKHLKEEEENVLLPPCWRTLHDLSPYHYLCRPQLIEAQCSLTTHPAHVGLCCFKSLRSLELYVEVHINSQFILLLVPSTYGVVLSDSFLRS